MAERILIVDDHPVVRLALRRWVEGSEDLEVAGEAGTGPSAVDVVSRLEPDVVLLDVHMSQEAGLATARLLHEGHPELRIVLVGERENRPLLEEAVRAGAWACLPKTWRPDELATIIRLVLERPRRDLIDLTDERQRLR